MTDKQPLSAFEYVAGTLTKEERETFELQMERDSNLAREVALWEEQLMAVQPQETRAPKDNTWQKIEHHVSPTPLKSNDTPAIGRESIWGGFSWSTLWQWASPSVAALVLIFAVIGYNPSQTVVPNTDYIAVLTDDAGVARLTALTTAEDKRMWLKWESHYKINPETNVQLWAISKRDGQTRPLGVFSSTAAAQIELDQAKWRLVTDAEFLILTEEEEGGSAIDEPSDIVLAKGFCVRFSSDEQDT